MGSGISCNPQHERSSPTSKPDGGRVVKIIHFNDVYNIEARDQEPVGGAARFVQKISDILAEEEMLVIFSGDAFNPSPMSTMFKGVQMVPVLNACNIAAAVYGNHDFDFGLDDLMELKSSCNFPWLMTNVIDKETDRPLGDGMEYLVLQYKDIKVGVLGLVESGWMETLSTIEMSEIEYQDYVEAADHYGSILKEEHGVDLVVALTHMRWNNDRRLAACAKHVDLILGGHDHNYGVEQVNNRTIIKSGTDFRELSKVTLVIDSENKVKTIVEKVIITSEIPENENIQLHVADYQEKVGAQMDKIIGEFGVPLETRFSEVRTKETNMGNFITDVMRVALRADVAILNSGTMRSDCIFPPGKFRMRDLSAILPIMDELLLLECTGSQLLKALENGVSKYPELEGRFPQLSGVQFQFEPKREPGSRILQDSVYVLAEPLDLQRIYKVAVKEYISRGKDGYTVFLECPRIGGDDDGPILDTLILNHFEEVQRQKECRKIRTEAPQLLKRKSIHRQNSLLMEKNHELVEAQIQTLRPVVCGRIRVAEEPLPNGNITTSDGNTTTSNTEETLT
ncbi:mannosylglucosyl-3-phosphoglycerate phosphatase-like isoform X2 [Bolinopsis microptera]|uniref:mannosylglucosyl-3-phosphoglycerate phosphatase-like isoform X2 n=1 Tax=Bolinopsis microptera TaxID=2820187 RepID=UPI0030795CF8